MGLLFPTNTNQLQNPSSAAVPGAKLYVYYAGTNNLSPVYNDPGLTNTRPNPMLANELGEFDLCYLIDGEYKVVVQDTKGQELLSADDISVRSNETNGIAWGFRSVQELLDDVTLSYSQGVGKIQVKEFDLITACGGRFAYQIAGADEATHHLTTANGVKLFVKPIDDGALPAAAFGLVADGIADDSGPTQTAINAASDSAGKLIWPAADIYLAQPVNLRRRITHVGSGRTNGLYAHDAAHSGTRFIVDSSDMFNNADLTPAGKAQQITFDNISFWSKAGGGVLFNMNAETDAVVENFNFHSCSFSQHNPDKQIWKSPEIGDAFDLHHGACNYFWAANSTVRMLDFTANTTNNITIKRFTATKSNKNDNSGVPFLRMDRASGGTVSNCEVSDGVLQQCVAGFAEIHACEGFVGRNLHMYDATVSASNPIFAFKASSGGVQPETAVLTSVRSGFGTAVQPDLKWVGTSGETGLVLIDCQFDFIDLGGSARWATVIGATPTPNGNIVSGHLMQVRGQGIRTLSSSGIEEVAIAGDGQLMLTDNLSLALQAATLPTFSLTQNNYDVGGGSFVRVSSTSNKSITGIVGGRDGRQLTLSNVGAFDITVRNYHSGSTNGNKFRNRGAQDIVLAPNDSARFVYDAIDEVWREC